MSVCEACARGNHASCTLQGCDCGNAKDGDNLADIADAMCPIDPDELEANILDPEQIVSLHETAFRGLDALKSRVQAQIDALTPKERAILEQHFKRNPLR